MYANESKYKCDSTSSACADLTFYYNEGTSGEINWMYARYYSSKWPKPDPTVSWSNASFGGACYAPWVGKGGFCDQESYVFANGGVPNPGHTYTHTPPFSGFDNRTEVNGLYGQAARQSIDLHRGNSNWTFSFCIANGAGRSTAGCY